MATTLLLTQVNNNPFMLIFGAFQLLLSQIPDFDRLWFLSILAAIMSFGYASIGFGLSVGKVTGTVTQDLAQRNKPAMHDCQACMASHWQRT